ncbi:MAG: hypothetical protein CSA53_07670 [Gammaproteobacteria bacterium]|nr:MAG: hypothetical protein CSA53_07670 [Gammaproteobacteria bacterium]
MKTRFSNEFVFQICALLLITVLVHAMYTTVVRPNAQAQLAYEAAQREAGQTVISQRSLSVVIADYEQEACFILLFWALATMGYKALQLRQEQNLLSRNLLDISPGTTLLPQDARGLSRALEALPEQEQERLLPRTLASALQRFALTSDIPAVADTVREQCELESDRLDSELSMVRYIAWAIPSIGFIGTVRGIGDALAQAYKAVEGDITGVTVSLGVAFNSTFVALVLSIILMLCLHQLQLSQERLSLNCQRYADKNLLRHLGALL